jgi:hypothetical protein
LLFKEPGTYIFSPPLASFIPDSAAFIVQLTDTLSLEVRKGQNYVANQIETPEIDISTTVYKKTRLTRPSNGFFGSPIHLGLVAIPFLFVGVQFGRRRFAASKLNANAEQSPFEKATADLNSLRSSTDSKTYFNGIRVILESYTANKLDILYTELTKERVLVELQKWPETSNVQQEYLEILTVCEQAVFAGNSGTAESSKLADRAHLLMESMERVFTKQ